MSDPNPHTVFNNHFDTNKDYRFCVAFTGQDYEQHLFEEMVHFLYWHREWTIRQIAGGMHKANTTIERALSKPHLCHSKQRPIINNKSNTATEFVTCDLCAHRRNKHYYKHCAVCHRLQI